MFFGKQVPRIEILILGMYWYYFREVWTMRVWQFEGWIKPTYLLVK